MLTCPVFPANLGTKKPATIEEAGEVLHIIQVEPAGVEPPSKQATRAAFSMLSPRLIFDRRLTVDGPSST